MYILVRTSKHNCNAYCVSVCHTCMQYRNEWINIALSSKTLIHCGILLALSGFFLAVPLKCCTFCLLVYVALCYILVINVLRKNHFTRVKRNQKDEFSVDVWKQVVMWQIWFLEEACTRQRRLWRRSAITNCRTSGSWNGKWTWCSSA